MTDVTTVTMRPRFLKVNAAAKYASRSRVRLYQLSTAHPGLFVKEGGSTLVSVAVLDRSSMRCRTRPQPRPSRGRYANNPELAKREREENTPRGHPSYR